MIDIKDCAMLIDLNDIYGHDDDVTDVTDEAVSELGEFDKLILLLMSGKYSDKNWQFKSKSDLHKINNILVEECMVLVSYNACNQWDVLSAIKVWWYLENLNFRQS